MRVDSRVTVRAPDSSLSLAVAIENANDAVNVLFDHYVNHSFASKEYQESFLERQLGQLLPSSNLKQRYSEQKLGGTDYVVKFPFVMTNGTQPVQALKPLHLGHDEPSKIIEHDDAWISKVHRPQRSVSTSGKSHTG